MTQKTHTGHIQKICLCNNAVIIILNNGELTAADQEGFVKEVAKV